MKSAARNRCKNREFVAFSDDFFAVCVFLIDGEKQFMLGKTRKFSDDFGERLIGFDVFRQRDFDFPFAGFICRRAEK